MLTKPKIIVFLSIIGICSIILLNTNYVNGNLTQPVTQILTNSGYIYPDANGTVDLRSLVNNPNTPTTSTITTYNTLDFVNIYYGVNYLDLHFSTGVSDMNGIKDSEPFDGTLNNVVINPKINQMTTPLKIELLINGQPVKQVITIPPSSTLPIYTKINQPFHKGDSLIWHTLDSAPNTLTIDTYTTILYYNILP